MDVITLLRTATTTTSELLRNILHGLLQERSILSLTSTHEYRMKSLVKPASEARILDQARKLVFGWLFRS